MWSRTEDLLRRYDRPVDAVRKIGRSRVALQIDVNLFALTHVPGRWRHVFDSVELSNRDILSINFNDSVLDGLSRDIFYGISLKKNAIFCGRPTTLKTDERNLLHCTTGPAIKWPGFVLYSLHGVTVDERIACHTHEMTRAEILGIRNTEIMRSIRDELGSEEFARKLDIVEKHREIVGQQEAILWQTREPVLGGGFRPTVYMAWVQVYDVSTGRIYFLEVNPAIKTAKEAVASTFRMRASEYDLNQEA